jgi:GDP-mannose 6-dehydrogenase
MRINIFGLGYVGCISAVCLANDGHDVTGIDIDQLKVTMINKAKSPIIEPGLQEALKKAHNSKKLKASNNNISSADISIVCVGTPSNDNGSLRLDYIDRVAEQIGDYLKKENSYHVVNIRSTVLPGTIEEKIIPIIEGRSKKMAGIDFGVCMNPEFMREGTSISDYYNPPFTVIGEINKKSGKAIAELYKSIDAPTFRTSIKVAEMVKYTCNTFHALKITFANEIGNICKDLNIDSHEVMNIFCQDTKLNISSYYMKPGFAFGGSCLPKDLRALLYKAKSIDADCPVIGSILRSNSNQIERAYRLISKTGKNNIGIMGISFKDGTDDLRESPMVELVEKLIGKGYNVSVYDKEVSLAKIYGANKIYIEKMIPHISSITKPSVQDVYDESEVIVICKKSEEIKEVCMQSDNKKMIIDLVRIFSNKKEIKKSYEGISW